MRNVIRTALTLLVLTAAPGVGAAQDEKIAKPNLVLRETVAGMPASERQELRVLTATFKPGDRTVTHTHRFPVTVYVLNLPR